MARRESDASAWLARLREIMPRVGLREDRIRKCRSTLKDDGWCRVRVFELTVVPGGDAWFLPDATVVVT